LLEDVQYPYLQKAAQARLNAARQLARISGLERETIFSLEANTYCLFPWTGTVAYRTLERLINFFVREYLDIRKLIGISPYYLVVKLGKSTPQEFYNQIIKFSNEELTEADLVAFEEAPKLQKYDEFIPNNLLRQAYASDYLNVAELRQIIQGW
jgi:ATP-dependent Lhr-like helicase